MPPKPAPIFSQPSPVIPRHPNHQHDIVTALVAVETLDTLPGDLTKTFGDLRELDAVLNSTTASLTHKLRSLTRALQNINPDINPGWGLPRTNSKAFQQFFANPTDATPQAHAAVLSSEAASQRPATSPSRPLSRFRSLLEIAEELTRYKIGVEDKVRVSGQACDTLIAHQAHLQALLGNSSIFLPTQATDSNETLHGWDGHSIGKRTRVSPPAPRVTSNPVQAGSDHEPVAAQVRYANANGLGLGEMTPSKKRKTGKDKGPSATSISTDPWEDQGPHEDGRSPTLAKKVPNAAQFSTSTNNSRHASKKRKNSPPASLQGSPVPSRPMPDAYQEIIASDRMNAGVRTRGISNGPMHDPHKYSTSNRAASHSMRIPVETDHINNEANPPASKATSSGSLVKRMSDLGNAAHRIASSGILAPERTGSKSNGRRDSSVIRHRNENRIDRIQPSVSDHDVAEADHDPTPYCYCQKQSYGEMIGCDSDECRYEWFHLSCLDLSEPPDGTWLCPECEAREQKEKRSKSKRGGNGKTLKKKV